jgi:hypothetical protein
MVHALQCSILVISSMLRDIDVGIISALHLVPLALQALFATGKSWESCRHHAPVPGSAGIGPYSKSSEVSPGKFTCWGGQPEYARHLGPSAPLESNLNRHDNVEQVYDLILPGPSEPDSRFYDPCKSTKNKRKQENATLSVNFFNFFFLIFAHETHNSF